MGASTAPENVSSNFQELDKLAPSETYVHLAWSSARLTHVLCYIESDTSNLTGNDLLAETKIYYKGKVQNKKK